MCIQRMMAVWVELVQSRATEGIDHKGNFSFVSMKTQAVTPHLGQKVLTRSHNKCFDSDIQKIVPKLSPIFHLICSTGKGGYTKINMGRSL